MLHKQIYLTLLSGLFLFTITNTSERETQLYKAVGTVIATQANDGINLLKEKYEWTTPALTKAQLKLFDKQVEAADKDLTLKDKQAGLNDQQVILNDKQATLNDKQVELTDKQIEENDLDRHMKKISITKETLALLDPNDPVAIETKKRLKLQMIEFNKDLPALPAEEEAKKPEPDKKDDEPKKDTFFSYLATYCILGATTVATMTDSIADYSFGCVTSLDCFKDGFIGKHQKAINRVFVAATAYALAYKSYSLYKAYQAEKNLTDEDVFNDDLD